MDLRTGARVRRFESVEMGAVTVIVLASVVQGFFLYRLVPELASLRIPLIVISLSTPS